MLVYNEMTNQWVNQRSKRTINETEKYYIHCDGKKYLDTQMGNSSFIFGYSDRKILSALLSNDVSFLHSAKTSDRLNYVTERLLGIANMSTVLWSHSGSDAVEAAVALNDEYWKHVDSSKQGIITVENNYHGATYLTKAARGEIFLDRFKIVREDEIEQAIDSSIGAVLVESIPWLHGVSPRSGSWWKNLRRVCSEKKINLIVDDVAGSFGKLGHALSTDRYGIHADIIATSKAITAGYVPFGATFANDKIVNILKKNYWGHSHTYNPSAFAIEACASVLDRIDDFKKIPQLETRLSDIFSTTGLEYTTIGLVGELLLPFNKTPEDYWKAGLELNIHNPNRFKIVMPVIADDEYFDCLEKSLRSLLSL
jgi:adenosylmethionine-8-amino-7-oxononanoate aminotransferase